MKYSVEWCWSNLNSTVTPSLPLPHKKNISTSTFMWMTNLKPGIVGQILFEVFMDGPQDFANGSQPTFWPSILKNPPSLESLENVETLYVWHAWFWCRKAVNVCWIEENGFHCHSGSWMSWNAGNSAWKLPGKAFTALNFWLTSAHVNMLKSTEKIQKEFIIIEDLSKWLACFSGTQIAFVAKIYHLHFRSAGVCCC